MSDQFNAHTNEKDAAYIQTGGATFQENERRSKVQIGGYALKIGAAVAAMLCLGLFFYLKFVGMGNNLKPDSANSKPPAPVAVREAPQISAAPKPISTEPHTVSDVLKEPTVTLGKPTAASNTAQAQPIPLKTNNPQTNKSAPAPAPAPVVITYDLGSSRPKEAISQASGGVAGSNAQSAVISSPQLIQTPQSGLTSSSTIAGRSGSVERDAYKSMTAEITKTAQGVAGKFGNFDYLISRGMIIPCGNREQITSGIAGQFICIVSEDVHSKNGAKLLVPKGSEVQGKINSSTNFGEERMPATMDRIITTKGLVVDFNSPVVDSLGGTGLPADVNNRWVQRIGASILLAGISDAIAIQKSLFNSVSSSSSTTSQASNTTSEFGKLADKLLDKTINLPPIMTYNRASEINIIVAQDLWFK